MNRTLLPAIWIIALIVGLPQFSETAYTTSLPEIAKNFYTTGEMAKNTLTIYLIGFSIGMILWGKISDQFGRKPCIISGLIIFIAGCIGCYLTDTIEMFMVYRFIQGFGGGASFIIAQSICRDAFEGAELSRVYSTIGTAIALFPALGSVSGGIIANISEWRDIFLFLIIFAVILISLIIIKIPETYVKNNESNISMANLTIRLVLDKKVVGFTFIAAGCIGMIFSYLAEGPFYLINGLGLSPSIYGITFFTIALSTIMGSIISRKLSLTISPKKIMTYGLFIIIISSIIFSSIISIHLKIYKLSINIIILTTIISRMIISFGICMVMGNTLALALAKYRYATGAASSLFGFFYYFIASLLMFGMTVLHNGTLLSMPLYFLAISLLMIIINYTLLKN